MRYGTEFERSIKVTLYRIACASSLQRRTMLNEASKDASKEMERNSPWMTSEWSSPEANLLWHIYERAVYDYVGMGTGKQRFGNNPAYRNDTAETGNITLSNGNQMNILVLLDISPAWSWAQIQTAINYTKMKEAA
jgi:hypothetical protein